MPCVTRKHRKNSSPRPLATPPRASSRFPISMPLPTIAARWLPSMHAGLSSERLHAPKAKHETCGTIYSPSPSCEGLGAPDGPKSLGEIAPRLRTPRSGWPRPLQGCRKVRHRRHFRKICRHHRICREEAAELHAHETFRQGNPRICRRRRPHRVSRKRRSDRIALHWRSASRRDDRIRRAAHDRRRRTKDRGPVFCRRFRGVEKGIRFLLGTVFYFSSIKYEIGDLKFEIDSNQNWTQWI